MGGFKRINVQVLKHPPVLCLTCRWSAFQHPAAGSPFSAPSCLLERGALPAHPTHLPRGHCPGVNTRWWQARTARPAGPWGQPAISGSWRENTAQRAQCSEAHPTPGVWRQPRKPTLKRSLQHSRPGSPDFSKTVNVVGGKRAWEPF